MKLEEMCQNSCSNNGECDKVIGCKCEEGFIEHDCSIKIKCYKDCNNNGICHNNGRCGCYPGWTGSLCEMKIPCRNNCTSTVNGVCQKDKTCKCNKGYSGRDCGDNDKVRKKDEYESLLQVGDKVDKIKTNCKNNCSGNGICNEKTKNCSCKDEFIGDDCSINLFKSMNINLESFKKEYIKRDKKVIANKTNVVKDESKVKRDGNRINKLKNKSNLKLAKATAKVN